MRTGVRRARAEALAARRRPSEVVAPVSVGLLDADAGPFGDPADGPAVDLDACAADLLGDLRRGRGAELADRGADDLGGHLGRSGAPASRNPRRPRGATDTGRQ